MTQEPPPQDITGGFRDPQEVRPGVFFFPGFGNVTAFITSEGIVLFDTGTDAVGGRVLGELRRVSDAPIHTIIYSHGHLDHVPGARHFIEEASQRGHPRPRVIGQERLVHRLRRYEEMAPWIAFIGSYQWDPVANPRVAELREEGRRHPFVYPDTIVQDRLTIEVGGERFDLFHALGETDDVLWLWNERRRLVCSGDLVINAAPNVGNPWKVQRYTREWAEALEAIAALRPDVLIPGHGPVTQPAEQVEQRTLTIARYLRSIHDQVVERMNAGQWLEQIWHEVRPPEDLAALRWLDSTYGHPQFIIQGVWRQYGGWWDGNPANMFPARTEAQAREVVAAAGADALLARARALQESGDLALACHLVDWVRRGEPANAGAWRLWRDLFAARAAGERNMMARNTYAWTVREAEHRLAELGEAQP